MIILGIDPGTHRAGFGLVDFSDNTLSLLKAGLLDTQNGRLSTLKQSIDALLKEESPDAIAVEKLFFTKNRTTGMSVAEARGVILLSAEECAVPIHEFSPTEIKTAVTGYGKSDKKAVLKMVQLILKEPDLDVIDDAADALAVAITACHLSRYSQK